MGRVAVIGDVGGHPDQLHEALADLGAHGESLRLPDDLTVIQVGDLIDRGPDSAGVLDLVRRLVDEQPEQWIQLIGNHEAQYLPGGTVFWREGLDDRGAGLLRSWWGDERIQVAAALRTVDGNDVLVTHAGLTVDAWRTLGEPITVTTAALRLNERPEPLPSPLWAEAGSELYEPWMRFYAAGGFVPFDQVHGHSSVVIFADQTWRCAGRIRQRASVDWAARHVRVRIGGRTFTGADPKHGRAGAARWRPLVFDDADVLVGATRAGYGLPLG